MPKRNWSKFKTDPAIIKQQIIVSERAKERRESNLLGKKFEEEKEEKEEKEDNQPNVVQQDRFG